jgi:hypothetical protein
MNDPRSDDVSDALPAEPHRHRAPTCPCCGGARFDWLGRLFERISYIPREKDGQMFALAQVFQARLRVCIDCGFVGQFAVPEFCEQLEAERDDRP